MNDFLALANLLQQPAYTGLSAEAAALALNTATETTTRPLSAGELLIWAISEGAFEALRQATTAESPEVRNLALGALRVFDAIPAEGIDVTDARMQAILNALIAVGVLPVGSLDRLIAAATIAISPATAAGLSYVAPGDVLLARGGVW